MSSMILPHSIWLCRINFGQKVVGALVFAALLLGVGAVHAAANVCDQAALRAADQHGIPPNILIALAKTKTNRTVDGSDQSWPWTVTIGTAGRWFDSKKEARAHLLAEFKLGARAFHIGCFQISYERYGSGFKSIDQLLDPAAAARFTARRLAALYKDEGSWPDAVSIFAAVSEVEADRLRAQFSNVLAELGEDPPLMQPTFKAIQPLIGNGAARTQLGSLVPVLPQAGRSLFDASE